MAEGKGLMYTDAFFESAALRQAIYYKKEVLKLPYPWTNDPKFLRDRFCNVFRWEDVTTKRILEAANGDLYKLIVYRSVSRVSTIDYLEEHWNGSSVLGLDVALRDLIKQGPVHTGAFFVWPVPGRARWELPGMLLDNLNLCAIDNAPTMQALTEYFCTIPGVGPFMAYEYATDISYLRKYPDECAWASFGPGARRGISRILYRERRPIDDVDVLAFGRALFSEWLKEDMVARVHHYLTYEQAEEAARPFYECLTMREVEHWLCEYDKYKRATPSKRRYP